MGKGFDRHGAAHNIHGSLADEASAQHQRMRTAFAQLPGDFYPFVYFYAAFESVPHIGFRYNRHVGAGRFHHLVHAHIHETHPVLQASSEPVFSAVGIGRKELADKISVSRMDFYAVEPGFPGQPYPVAEGAGHFRQFIFLETAVQGRGVHVEASGGGYRHASGHRAVAHVSAMPDLYGGGCPFRMDGIGNFPQPRHRFFPEP